MTRSKRQSSHSAFAPWWAREFGYPAGSLREKADPPIHFTSTPEYAEHCRRSQERQRAENRELIRQLDAAYEKRKQEVSDD